MTALPDIVHAIEIDAPREAVWEVLTGEDCVPRWLGCMSFAPHVGTTFYMQPDAAKRKRGDVSGATHCNVLTLLPPRILEFSWYMPGTPATTVKIELADLGGGRTRATLTHSGWSLFPPEMIAAIRGQLDGGWKGFVLPALKRESESVRAS